IGEPGRRTSSWPATSSRVRGRMRTASGGRRSPARSGPPAAALKRSDPLLADTLAGYPRAPPSPTRTRTGRRAGPRIACCPPRPRKADVSEPVPVSRAELLELSGGDPWARWALPDPLAGAALVVADVALVERGGPRPGLWVAPLRPGLPAG